jgi:hypothetical protein
MASLFSARSGMRFPNLAKPDGPLGRAIPPRVFPMFELEPAQRAEAVKLLDLLGMSLRQVILAVIVGVLLAALVLWLAPWLVG